MSDDDDDDEDNAAPLDGSATNHIGEKNRSRKRLRM
jgi:hypothetical protein